MSKLNPSIKHHLLVAIFIALRGFLFAFFLRPFNDDTTGFLFWIRASIGFNIIAFLAYSLITLLQHYTYQRFKKWNIGFEITTILSFHLLYTAGTYLLYKTPWINGGLSFIGWNTQIMLKVALVNLPVIAIARSYLIKLIPKQDNTITLKGENKLDILKLKNEDLVCISNAQNYVEVFYLQQGQLQAKLLRASLKNIKEEHDFLLSVHRSHLINPAHFISWKDKQTISLTEMEVPVSKSFNKALLTS